MVDLRLEAIWERHRILMEERPRPFGEMDSIVLWNSYRDDIPHLRRHLEALTRRAEAAEAVLDSIPNILRSIPVRNLDELITAWQQAKAAHEKVVNSGS